MPVVAVLRVERGEVELVDHVEDELGEMALGEPIAQVGWQQEGLVAVTAHEVVSHRLFYYFALFAPNAVRRGADALVATGWRGAVNYFDQVAPLAAVVRSWEGRFGARVVGLGGATALLSVAAPPVTFEHALQVAAEHLMCCSDNVTGVGTLAEYAEGICGETTWSFWWD